MVTVLQWVGGILLGIVALSAFVLFSASVLAAMEQPTIPTVVVSAVISFVLLLIMIAASVGAWGLITAALAW